MFMTDIPINIISEEAFVPPPEDVIISQELINLLEERTRLSQNDESLVYLLGKSGYADTIVEVGTRINGKVYINDDSDIIEKLKPFFRQGYKIHADYHNHPKTTIDQYKAKGMPVGAATSPSTTDINISVTDRQKKLGQRHPRIIGIYDDSTSSVIMSAFHIFKPAPFDPLTLAPFEFEGPIQRPEIGKKTKLGVTLLPVAFTDPQKLIQMEYIQPVDIKIPTLNPKISVIKPSPL